MIKKIVIIFFWRLFITSSFAQSLRQAKISIREILAVCLWVKFLPFLILNKIERLKLPPISFY